ncbi:hypothetical protein HMSSN036_05280 [Paenibacillus macerans]|nr:hypothetical protein HMSSN036_05280 [Paenibacillus macerans]
MGLFDDDFYSTKVPGRRRLRMPEDGKRRWLEVRRGQGLSTLQISLISSVLSAVVAVLLFSFIVGLPSTTSRETASAGAAPNSANPFDRIRLGCGQGGSGGSQHPESQRAVARGSRAGGARSGVIFKKAKGKAYIITNTHVISGSEDLEVVTSDGVSHKAKVTGQDSINDIAVLEIGDRGIHSVIDVGDSNKLRAGETVIAVGNPLGLRGTLTSGIVSNTSRMIPVSLNQDGGLRLGAGSDSDRRGDQ